MQAKGIEIGLVAKLAGHANPAVTLRYYTQSGSVGKRAIQALRKHSQPGKERDEFSSPANP
jgi:hypothetical protein